MIRPLRGRVIVREDVEADYSHLRHIVVPDVINDDHPTALARRRTWHRGRVVAMGEPARTRKGAEVPHGFNVGDLIVFHWAHLESAWTFEWPDGSRVACIPQECVDGVYE